MHAKLRLHRRKRTATSRPLSTSTSSAMTTSAYEAWLSEQGVRLDGVRIACDALGAIRLVSTRALKPDECIVRVPKTAVLSVKTASNPAVEALLDEAALDKAGGFPDSAVQTLVVAYQRSLGAASRWHAYFASMQEPADLPILWGDDELALLRGSGIDEAARAWRAQLAHEHRAMTHALREAGAHFGSDGAAMAQLPLAAYVHAATLMASRGFYVSSAHGDALVPGPDAANHKCALAPEEEEEEEAEEAAEAEETEDGGEDTGPRALRQAGPALRAAAAAVAAGGASALAMDCAFDSLGGDSEDDDEEEGEEEEDGEEEEGEEGEVGLVALRAVGKGREVFNTYGEHSSAKLLLDYGFVPHDNPLDTAESARAQ